MNHDKGYEIAPFNYMSGRPSFNMVMNHTWNLFLSRAHRVDTGKWQGVDTGNKPDLATYELMNFTFTQDLKSWEDINWWQRDVEPNLPWADDHFEERVCGYPINPGVEWANWPWGGNAAKFREPVFGPTYIPPQDLAYLAGMIDGEGTIYYREGKEHWQGCIRIYQKDRSICDQLLGLFKVGKVTSNNEKTKTNIHGKVVDNHCWYWQVSAQHEIRWLLHLVLPFLRIKREKAQAAYKWVCQCIEKSKYPQQVRVWGQDWEPRFNHNYMSRYWPTGENKSPYLGMGGNEYGDLNDLVASLAKNPQSRQEWFPIFHPEDVGEVVGGRKPCSLGYQFWVRGDRLHVYYPMRSCDFFRHMRDDIYLTIRLLLWVLEECRMKTLLQGGKSPWDRVTPGTFTMHCTSLHVFANDMVQMKKEGPRS